MYRYSVDNALTYTPDDLVLFRESPFAVWMERLTLENPDHGIPPDLNSTESQDEPRPHDDMVTTLRAEGRNVAQIDWNLDEASRRAATLAAMRAGADFILDGVLALGILSGNANMLMRTSGYSELGDFLYVPCETSSGSALHSAFRLSFMADLLQSLQGQLPPQMLIIRDGADVQPLQTEDYIYYYQAVKKRFMDAMEQFRKHRMPDPAESSHFGRWSECASEVLKQRALRESEPDEENQVQEEEEFEAAPLQVAGAAGSGQVRMTASSRAGSGQLETGSLAREGTDRTLAEQARELTPGSYRAGAAPGHTPNLARFGKPVPVAVLPDRRSPEHNRRSADDALQNLQFIGSGTDATFGPVQPPAEIDREIAPAPPPSLRELPPEERSATEELSPSFTSVLPEVEPRAPLFLPPDEPASAESLPVDLNPRARDSDNARKDSRKSVIDMDSAPPPSLAPVVQRAEAELERIGLRDPMFNAAGERHSKELPGPKEENKEEGTIPSSPFSSSLITSEEIDEN